MARQIPAEQPGNSTYETRMVWALRGFAARRRAVGRNADAQAADKEADELA